MKGETMADEPTRPLTENETNAVAAAARRVQDDEQAEKAGTPAKADDGP